MYNMKIKTYELTEMCIIYNIYIYKKIKGDDPTFFGTTGHSNSLRHMKLIEEKLVQVRNEEDTSLKLPTSEYQYWLVVYLPL